jgi:hypothetical protein
MSRTYWEKKPDGAYEFLGAFRDGHAVKDQRQPQAKAAVIDITDRDIQGVLDSLADRVLLVGLPSAITKRLQARMPWAGPWAQIEGFAK